MQSTPNQSNYKNLNDWEKFCDLLWFSNELEIWLDISKVNFNKGNLFELSNKFNNVFKSIHELEKGAISNIDEKRQVGHYWLRNSSIAPSNEIKDSIDKEISKIKCFGDKILKGEVLNNNNRKFTDVLWIGIGGSSLGPLLIIESLKKQLYGLNFSFIDNIDPFLISEKLSFLKDRLDTTLFVVVSKSGGTPEPRIAMELLENNISSRGIDWSSQAVAITMLNSKLYKKALSSNWLEIFDLPDWVGGRTSITGSVGLLPLALINENINDFLKGASRMDEITRCIDINHNPAALMALSWYIVGNGSGERDMVVLPYRDRLQVFSKYLQQLVMESLGKKLDRSGNVVHQGLSVFGNKGSTDQHAYVQQLRDGIDNFFCVFIELLDSPPNLSKSDLDNPKDYLSGFLQGTRSALASQGRQSITITINKLNSLSLGALIALFERAVSFYAELININAYDQPGVEAGKKAASDVIEIQRSITKIFMTGQKCSINDLKQIINNSSEETIYFILRQMCFDNDNYIVEGEWSNPKSIKIKKID